MPTKQSSVEPIDYEQDDGYVAQCACGSQEYNLMLNSYDHEINSAECVECGQTIAIVKH